MTFGGRNRFPVWSADGQYVTFQSDREGDRAVFWQRADGSAPPVRLTKPESGTAHVPDAWSPTNDQLLIDVEAESRFSLAILNVRDRKVIPFDGVQSASVTPAAIFSPDGRWVAYQSSETPNPRIFIQPVPASGTAFPVANGRGPRCSSDGKQLYYTVADRMFSVVLKTEPTLSVSNPVVVTVNPTISSLRFSYSTQQPRRNWDLTPDNRFVAIVGETPTATSTARHIEVVLDWFEELTQRVPVR